MISLFIGITFAFLAQINSTVPVASFLCSSKPATSTKTRLQEEDTPPNTSDRTRKQDPRKEVVFKGICDGSAAVRLTSDTILVAYDEQNVLFTFSISGGTPIARKKLGPLLGLSSPKEIDLEGGAVAENHIWWIGSHGLDSKGRVAPNRRLLFATNIPSPDLQDIKLVKRPIDLFPVLLRSNLLSNVLTKEVQKRLPKEGGINVEGIASLPDGGLLIGFRSPLSAERKALLVSLMPQEDTFKVDAANWLDLSGRGVRDVIKSNSGYSILAGPMDAVGGFAIYSWSPRTPPRHLSDLVGLNAESLIDLGNEWLVLSDDGKTKRKDPEAKDGDRACDNIRKKNSQGETHPNVYFRARRIPK